MTTEYQPELIEGTYPTGKYRIQTNCPPDPGGHAATQACNRRARERAARTIAEIEALTTPEAYAPKSAARPMSPKRRSAALGVVNGAYVKLASMLQPKRAPGYIGAPLRDRPLWGNYTCATETIGGEPWRIAAERMLAVAQAINWGRKGGAVPGDYIPETLEEAQAIARGLAA